ncbi:hypothetical protein TKK_0000980 [Trichogramma kaykai]
MSQREAALRLNISQATLSRVLKNRYEIKRASSSDENSAVKGKILDSEQNVIANDIAKKTSLLDRLHQVNQAWSYVSSETIKNCYRKAGFVKDAKDIPSNVSNVDSIEIYPQDMPNEESNEWVNIDENLQTSVKPTDDDICQEAIQTESEDEDDDDDFEPAPTSTEMFNALQVLRRGVQNYADSFEEYYKFEKFISAIIDTRKKQKYIDDYFTKM